MHNFLKSAALAVAVAFTAGQADAETATPNQQASYTLQITGFVPTICRATLSQDMVSQEEGVADLGMLQEFCNDSSGYQVWIDSTPGIAGMVYVDGEQIPLSMSGTTLISASATAAKRARHVALDTGEDGALTSLSIRVVAL